MAKVEMKKMGKEVLKEKLVKGKKEVEAKDMKKMGKAKEKEAVKAKKK